MGDEDKRIPKPASIGGNRRAKRQNLSATRVDPTWVARGWLDKAAKWGPKTCYLTTVPAHRSRTFYTHCSHWKYE